MESKKRSLIKGITWELLGIITLPIIVYVVHKFISNEVTNLAFWTTSLFYFIRFIMYYYHERIWTKIKWGMEQ